MSPEDDLVRVIRFSRLVFVQAWRESDDPSQREFA